MADLYYQLKNERENRGLRRVDVARATNVYIHHLAALEYANYDELPEEDSDLEGCVRAYADYLGLDADAMAAEFLREREVRRPQPPPEEERERMEVVVETPPPVQAVPEPASVPSQDVPHPREVSPRRRPVAAFAAIGGALLVISTLVWLGLQWNPDSTPEVSMPAVSEELPLRVADEPPAIATPSPAAPETVPVRPQPTTPVAAREEPPLETPKPAPVPEPPPPAPNATASLLTVTEQGVGTRVVNLRLEGETDRFAVGDRVWYWTRVAGGARGRTIQHVWIHEGRVTDRVRLKLGSASWRTYSRKKLYSSLVGRWTVETRDESGNVLASSEFVVTD